jgi:hypothetical protein
MRWDQTSERAYLDYLIDAVKKGQRTDIGWKPEVIGNAIIMFQGKGLKAFTKQQFETKRDGWKKKWKLFNTILNITGFGYNEHTGCIEAEDDCWDRVLLQYRATKLYTKPNLVTLTLRLWPLAFSTRFILLFLCAFNRADQRAVYQVR